MKPGRWWSARNWHFTRPQSHRAEIPLRPITFQYPNFAFYFLIIFLPKNLISKFPPNMVLNWFSSLRKQIPSILHYTISQEGNQHFQPCSKTSASYLHHFTTSKDVSFTYSYLIFQMICNKILYEALAKIQLQSEINKFLPPNDPRQYNPGQPSCKNQCWYMVVKIPTVHHDLAGLPYLHGAALCMWSWLPTINLRCQYQQETQQRF